MKVFYTAACDALMNQMCTALTARATELRGMLADWKAFITDEAINDVMVKSDVLGNKHRPHWNAKAKELSDVLTRAEEASKCLKITPPFEEDKRTSGAKALADSAVASTYETMMITAAANAVYNFGEKPQGPAMAKKALAIVDEQEKFALQRSAFEAVELLDDVCPYAAREATDVPVHRPRGTFATRVERRACALVEEGVLGDPRRYCEEDEDTVSDEAILAYLASGELAATSD